MKISKVILRTILCLSIVVCNTSIDADAQVAKVFKSITKIFSKKTSSETIESAEKAVVKKGLKEGSYDLTRQVFRDNSLKSLTVNRQLSQRTLRETSVGQIESAFAKRVYRALDDNVFVLSPKRISGYPTSILEQQFVKKLGTQSSKEVFENLSRNRLIQAGVKKADELRLIKVNRRISGDAANNVIENVPDIKTITDGLKALSPVKFSDDRLIVEQAGNCLKIRYQGSSNEMIFAKDGRILTSSDIVSHGNETNEFLMNMLPRRKYDINNGLIQVETDGIGRRHIIESHTSELYKKLNLLDDKSGLADRDVQSLIFGNDIRIDNKKLNKIKQKELMAVENGSDVWSRSTVTYHSDSRYDIAYELRVIDPLTGKEKNLKKIVKENKSLKSESGNNSYKAASKSRPVVPQNGSKGHWDGERGNSTYILNPDSRPSNNNYRNPDNLTVKEMGKQLNDPNPSVKYQNGHPVFDKDGGTSDGKPLQADFPSGIEDYINYDEVRRKNGKNINRQKLHEEAFRRIAQKMGKSVDEIKVFKGDEAAAERLADKWNCSVDEVFKRCNNPERVQRVLHECEDGKTVQLVPRLYHDGVRHSGGIEKVVSEILQRQ